MSKRIRVCVLTLIGLVAISPAFGNEIIQKYLNKIDQQKTRIDLLDGVEDTYVTLKSEVQSSKATETYLTKTEEIVRRVTNNGELSDALKIDQLRRVEEILKKINSSNVHFYTQFEPTISLIRKVQTIRNVSRLKSVLHSNVFSSLNLIAFYIEQPVAESFLMSAAKVEPEELLLHYSEIDYKPFSEKVLDEVARVAPMKIKTYLHSWNPVHQRVKGSENRLTSLLYDIFQEKGTVSKAYVLINDIFNVKLSIDEAHEIGKNDNELFEYLIEMRADKKLNGEHSVDEALKYQCLKHVRVINDLHEESDAVRFASLTKFNASEIYTLMVYSEDEIYTSTFLGMYNRMMAKMEAESTYEFLHHLSFNKFRTFVKMAAGYNELNGFLAKMTNYEKKKLFEKLVSNIENANDNLESAVSIADTYGSLASDENKKLMEDAILKYYDEIRYSDPEAEKLYSLVLSVFEIGEETLNGQVLSTQAVNMKVLPLTRIFKDGKNVQQHFFFDDPDGRASYSHFIGTFSNGNWTILDKGTYIIVSSASGKKIEIYANKPSTEYAGQDAIKAIFMETGRWPDIVVHRGHSYFASAAIESLTPNVEVVFLGSCGGYNNIANVLKYSPNAQIISSKQIGTMLVNDRLCLELNEVIRRGDDVAWDTLWTKLDNIFPNGSTADSRFKDYIPPHKNLGALLIKTYRGIL